MSPGTQHDASTCCSLDKNVGWEEEPPVIGQDLPQTAVVWTEPFPSATADFPFASLFTTAAPVFITRLLTSLVAQMVKNLPAIQETHV